MDFYNIGAGGHFGSFLISHKWVPSLIYITVQAYNFFLSNPEVQTYVKYVALCLMEPIKNKMTNDIHERLTWLPNLPDGFNHCKKNLHAQLANTKCHNGLDFFEEVAFQLLIHEPIF